MFNKTGKFSIYTRLFKRFYIKEFLVSLDPDIIQTNIGEIKDNITYLDGEIIN